MASTHDGNACAGFAIGTAIFIPAYLSLAWVLSRVLRIDYGLALVGCLVVGSVAGGIVLLVGLVKAKRM